MNRKTLGAAAALAFAALLPALAIAPTLAFAQDNKAAMNAFMDANHRMMNGMSMNMSGNPDKDFVAMMIPHHQGAVDMAKIELARGKDPMLRRLSRNIIASQERQIREMKAWEARHPAGR